MIFRIIFINFSTIIIVTTILLKIFNGSKNISSIAQNQVVEHSQHLIKDNLFITNLENEINVNIRKANSNYESLRKLNVKFFKDGGTFIDRIQ